MNCKDCKFYDPRVEIRYISATSISSEFTDIERWENEWLVENYQSDEWYQEHFKDFKVESQILGVCKSGKLSYRVEYGITDSLFYQDSEDYSAGHVVGPDFGCVHFEYKSGVLSTDSPEVKSLIEMGR